MKFKLLLLIFPFLFACTTRKITFDNRFVRSSYTFKHNKVIFRSETCTSSLYSKTKYSKLNDSTYVFKFENCDRIDTMILTKKDTIFTRYKSYYSEKKEIIKPAE
jgi:dUTPase